MGMNNPVSVLLVDDDAMVRTELRMILAGTAEVSIVGEAENGAAALEVVTKTRPDVVLLDVRMPVMDGLAAAKQNLDSLTTRERDVARLLAEGRSNQDIAHELYMSLATVKANITRIFLKLEVDNRVAAAMRIRDGGGIPKD
mgnify:FL=1